MIALGLARCREEAQALLMAGHVFYGEQRVEKPGTLVSATAELSLRGQRRYVSRGGTKLAAALEAFDLKPCGATALDVGAATGGFADCLLQHGCSSVYAVDVGRGLLHPQLLRDPRVTCYEGLHARDLGRLQLSPRPNFATVDVSFIRLGRVLQFVVDALEPPWHMLPMVKPQFEVSKEDAPGGVVVDAAIRDRAVQAVAAHAHSLGCKVLGSTPAGVSGPKGNQEIFLLLTS